MHRIGAVGVGPAGRCGAGHAEINGRRHPAAGCGQADCRPEGAATKTLDGLARQIAEIDTNVANLGPKNAAALRFRAVSLAAYQRAWAELTRPDGDLGDPACQESVAGLAEPQR
jgi:hypothetical protein